MSGHRVGDDDRQDEGGEPADRMLTKLGLFVASLDTEERELFAALLAPGVALAYAGDDRETEDVRGFEAPTVEAWSPNQLPDALRARLRQGRLRIEID